MVKELNMKKILLFVATLFLVACSDNAQSEWVAQVIPKQEKPPALLYDAKVPVYSPTATTFGYVIHQDERNKWVLVNAQEVANHGYALVHDELLTLGEVEGIDETTNIALIHIRNSFDFQTLTLSEEPIEGGINLASHELSYFETTLHDETIRATAAQIQALLDETLEQPLKWQERYEKNDQIKIKDAPLVTNFTTYYEKNLFTYSADELMNYAMEFMERLNTSIKQDEWASIKPYIGSDDVYKEIQYVTKPVVGYDIREVKKEGVYYFVNGVDKERAELRLTFINEQGYYKLIGTNLISSDALKSEKMVSVDLNVEQKIEQLPALQMFMRGQLAAIKIVPLDQKEAWQLENKDKKISVTVTEKTKQLEAFNCSDLVLEDGQLQLIGCKESSDEAYRLGEMN